MSDKERLAKIKKQRNNYGSDVHRHAALKVSDLQWLIEQAEQEQKLNELINSHAPDGRNYTNAQYVELLHERQSLYEEVNRLREALAFYANEKMWTEPTISYHEDNSYKGPPNAIEDSGDIARKALEETK